ncbi:MAG: VWA domain-containing protein [Ignavibacteria bacterium]|nr:VWA domain-containing protein [Ignavibacteria bacterium]
MIFVHQSQSGRRALALAGIALLGCLPFIEVASAQPQLNFKRLVNNWPTIELYFNVTCHGVPVHLTDQRYFRVLENGRDVGDFEMCCPDVDYRFSGSLSMVLDASGSMLESGKVEVKATANALIDCLDGINDEAAVIVFRAQSRVIQAMTPWLDSLRDAVNALPVEDPGRDSSAIWDACYEGIEALVADARNPSRAVVLVTDGADNCSSRTPADIIILARTHSLRVFTVGVGPNLQSVQLRFIADMTGARYYESPGSAQLIALVREIPLIHFPPSYQECIITYKAHCMTGTERNVDLSVINFCNGQDTKTKTYTAPKDTSTYIQLEDADRQMSGTGNTDVTVPIELLDDFHGELFYGATFSIQFDPACIAFKGIKTPPGSVFEGVPITITSAGDMITFTTTEKKLLDIQNVPASMAELTFTTSDPDGDDTVCCPIKFTSWVFKEGCFGPRLRDGEICIIPRQPLMAGSILAPPRLRWAATGTEYDPNTFTVTAQVWNFGDRAARSARFRIEFDERDMRLVSPLTSIQSGLPQDVEPARNCEARWAVQAKPRLLGDSIRICIVTAFDNHDSVRSCLKVWVPAATNTVGVGEQPSALPSMPMLELYPQPFGHTLSVRAVALRNARHRLTVTDLIGREVHARDYFHQTEITVSFDMRGVPSGFYFVRLSGEDALLSRTVLKE